MMIFMWASKSFLLSPHRQKYQRKIASWSWLWPFALIFTSKLSNSLLQQSRRNRKIFNASKSKTWSSKLFRLFLIYFSFSIPDLDCCLVSSQKKVSCRHQRSLLFIASLMQISPINSHRLSHTTRPNLKTRDFRALWNCVRRHVQKCLWLIDFRSFIKLQCCRAATGRQKNKASRRSNCV